MSGQKLVETAVALSVYDAVKVRGMPPTNQLIVNGISSAGFHLIEETFADKMVIRFMPQMMKEGKFLMKTLGLMINEGLAWRFLYGKNMNYGPLFVKSIISNAGQETYRMLL